jgi:hypothetical protein
VYEIVFANRLASFLERNSLLTPNQHGFRKGRPTNSAIYEAIDFIPSSIDRKQKALCLLSDFPKAFNMVS